MKVLLSGYYGFDNTGDEAILLSLVREFKHLGAQPLVLSQTPSETSQHLDVASFGRMKPLALLQAIFSCDVLISGGGGLLQDKTSHRNLTYYLGIIRVAKLLGKRVVVFNQSIGPLSSEGLNRTKQGLAGVHCIVRDRGSLALLASLGVPAELGGDPALLLSPNPVRRDPNLVILAPRGGQREATERLGQLAASLQKAGKTVLALAFQPEIDLPECELIAQMAPGSQVLGTTDPQTALDTIAAAGYVVGVRLHAVILAAAAQTPFIGLSYDPKVAGFCEDGGAYQTSTAFEVADVAQRILANAQPNWQAVAEMKQRAQDSFRSALSH